MTPERWQRVEALYHATRSRSETDRAAFLAEACDGDEELRREVESLLAQPVSVNGLVDGHALSIAERMMGDGGPSVLIGRRLGAYQVHARLGAGGMGEVYQAHDMRLGRDVAIKVLPSLFTADADRLARFEREARLLAALNHPNIGAIYGLEDADGVSALVLELVEGDTLAERIARGPVPAKDALAIARQIADALDAAHEKGIIHRDLKPANVKVTPDGVVKVLDFGLAKAASGDGSGPDLTQSPTVTVGGTRAGHVLGTAAYMSPEQARGRPVDKRTDIWAFGCVLYEMLTGRMAFGGETISDAIAAILAHEPDWTALPATTPPSVTRLIRRCLEKDPKRRLRDIADARTEIEDALAASPAVSTVPAVSAPRFRRMAAFAAAGLLVVLLAAVLIPRLQRPSPVASRSQRSVILLPPGQDLDRHRGGAYSLAVSPDGARLVYSALSAGRFGLWVREISTFDVRPISGTDGADQPFFSPDGQWVGFFGAGALHKVALTGGPPARICDVPYTPIGGSWSADGRIVFAMKIGGADAEASLLQIVSAAGGTAQPLPNSNGAQWPDLLPDGKTVLFTSGNAIVTIAIDGGARRVVARTRQSRSGEGTLVAGEGGIRQARYARTGHLIYGQGFRVMAVPFDPDSLTLKGSPVPVLDGVFRQTGGGAVQFAVSATGVLVYAPEGREYELTWVDRGGRVTPIGVAPDAFRYPRLSPDATRLAVMIDTPERRSDIWIYDLNRGTRSRLTNDAHYVMPVWTPDGTRVTFSGGRVFWREADGSGSTELLLGTSARYPTSWSPDGQVLLVNATDSASPDLWALPRGDQGSARPLLNGPSEEWFGQFSPNGRFIAYMSNESGRSEVYVVSYPDLRGRVAVSTGGGTFPIWSRDGRELFYRQGNDGVVGVNVETTGEFRAGRPQLLFKGPFVAAGGDRTFDVAPDGRFLMIRTDDATSGRQLNLVTSWFEELERLAPSQQPPQ